MNLTRNCPVTGTIRRSSSAQTSISSWVTTAPCLGRDTSLAGPRAIASLAKPFYENRFPHRIICRAGGARHLVVDGSVPQSGESHPPAPHGIGPHRLLFVERKRPGTARRRAKSGRVFFHQCRIS